MTTYVDDCDLDSAKPLRSLVWKVVRTQVAAKDPVQMQKFLGVVREAWNGTSSCRGLRLTQSHYTAKVLEDAVKLGFWSDPCLYCCWSIWHATRSQTVAGTTV